MTRAESTARQIHILIAFFVLLPLGFAYLYYCNCEVISMLLDERAKPLPAAKHPSLFLMIVFWMMVGNVSMIFLLLNLLLLSTVAIGIWLH